MRKRDPYSQFPARSLSSPKPSAGQPIGPTRTICRRTARNLGASSFNCVTNLAGYLGDTLSFTGPHDGREMAEQIADTRGRVPVLEESSCGVSESFTGCRRLGLVGKCRKGRSCMIQATTELTGFRQGDSLRQAFVCLPVAVAGPFHDGVEAI